MAIKLYYNKNTYQLITIDDGGESIVVGDDGGKEFHFYFGTGTELSDYVNDATIPVNFLGRAVIERPDGEVTNELYLTPQSGYFKLIITDWISQVEGNLEITTRLKVSDGDGGYVVYPFTVATIPVEAGVAPGDDTIEDAQYQALLDAVNAIPTGTTPFQQIILYNAAGNAIATYNGTNITWAYRGINAEMFENLFVEVTANGDIANGDVVQYDSAIGASGKIRAKKAVASEINANPKLILGVATNAITNGQDGTVNWFGEINGINTTGYTSGQIVYYASESATPGQFTATKPTAPNVQIELGIVKVVHGTQGVIKIRPCFGMFLSELHDINVNGHVFVGGETIMFNIATNRYEIYDLGGKVVEIEGRIGLVETGLGTAEGDIIALEGRMDTAEGDIVVAEQDIDDLEEANMVKTVAYNTSSHVLTLTYFDDTTSTIDLPLESAIVSASYDNDTKDITFTLQSGSTLVVPLDDLISGLASEAWVTEYFIAKSQIVNDLTTGGATDVLSAEQGKTLQTTTEKVANKKSVINDSETEYPNSKAVIDYVRDIGLDTPIAKLNNHSLREVFEEGQLLSNSDISSIDNYTFLGDFLDSGYIFNGNIGYIYIQHNGQWSGLYNNSYTTIANHSYYYRINVQTYAQNVGFFLTNSITSHSQINIGQTYNEYSSIFISNNSGGGVFTVGQYEYITSNYTSLEYMKAYDLTSLGLSSLTVSQMDYWFNVYQEIKEKSTTAYLLDAQEAIDELQDEKVAKTAIVNDLTTGGATKVLSAEMGKTLKGITDALDTRVETLESKIDVVGLDYKEYGVREVVGQSSSDYERVTRFGGEVKLGSATGLVANVAIDDADATNSFDYIPIFKREKVSVDATDLSSNTVSNTFVKVPKYYIKEEWTTEGGTDYHYIFMSQFKHEGYRLPLPFKKTDGSERDYTYIGAYEAYLDGNNKLRSLTGQIPKVSYSRNSFRTAARALDGLGVNSKYQITDLAEYVDLVQIPFMIEFATKHSQGVFLGATLMAYSASHTAIADGTGVNAIVVSNATGANFVLGQTVSIGTSNSNDSIAKDRIVTQIQVDTPNAGKTTITFDGAAVNIAIGNVVASRAWKTGMTDSVKVSGTHALNDGKHSIVWRGLENPFGNIWKNVDGVKISNCRGYVAENPKDYNDTASVAGIYAEPYLPLGYLNANTNNYAQDLGYDANYPYAKFPISVQANSGLFFRDYYYQNSGDRTVFVGGFWSDGSPAGLFCWPLNSVLGLTIFFIGARLSYRP